MQMKPTDVSAARCPPFGLNIEIKRTCTGHAFTFCIRTENTLGTTEQGHVFFASCIRTQLQNQQFMSSQFAFVLIIEIKRRLQFKSSHFVFVLKVKFKQAVTIRVFTICIRCENQNQSSLSPLGQHD